MHEPVAARGMRIGLLPALGCAALGIVANELDHVPGYFASPAIARRLDMGDPSPAGIALRLAGEVAMALLMIAFVRAVAHRRADLIVRPGRFIAWILLGATLGFAVVQGAALAFALPVVDAGARLLGRDWAVLMMWCGLFGWLFFLYLRRREDRARLAMMLMRRVLLMRQLAQSRLGAARAQIEPEMIAGVLRTVRAQAASQGGALAGTGTLLDPAMLIEHLATYLRLLLDRMRHGAPTLLTDLALVRSLVALREAETGIALELRVDAGVDAHAGRSAMATFLVARAMLDAAVQCAPSQVRLALRVRDASLAIQVLFAGPDMSSAVRAHLAATLAGLQPGAGAASHRFESGMHCHEVHVPLQ